MAVQLLRRKFTIAEYYQMATAGIFLANDRVELMAGEIIEMSPIGSRHAACVDRLNRLFNRLLANQVIVRVQNPIRLSDRSEPQPDLTLLQPRSDFYAEGHPQPSEVLLLVEVSDTRLGCAIGRSPAPKAIAKPNKILVNVGFPLLFQPNLRLWYSVLFRGLYLLDRDLSPWRVSAIDISLKAMCFTYLQSAV